MWPDQVTVATVWKYSTNLSRGLDQQGQPRASRNEALAAKHHPYSSTVLAATIDSEKKNTNHFFASVLCRNDICINSLRGHGCELTASFGYS